MTRARDVANLIGSGNYSSTTFTATAGQTAFSISHTQGFVQVFMNGLLLDLTTDYTSNGSAITLTSGAAAGDEIEVVAYNTFSVGDALNQAAADTRYVNTAGDTMTGALTGTSAGFTGDINIGNNDASNPVSKLRLGATQYGAADIVPVSTGHKIGLDFKTDSTGDTTIDPVTRMSISNEGYVTTPFQPHIELRGSNASRIMNQGTSANYTAFSQQTAVGITWNSSNGRITVPIAGRYLFVGKFYQWIDNVMNHWIIPRLNGTAIAEYQTDFASIGAGGNTDHVVTTADIVNMAANDYIEYYMNADIYGGYPHTNLQAFLLG